MDEDRIKWCVEKFFYAQKDPRATNFHAILFRLIQKADPENYERLNKGFPEECHVYERWQEAGDEGNDLFREYGLM